jgi:hypothetical protein
MARDCKMRLRGVGGERSDLGTSTSPGTTWQDEDRLTCLSHTEAALVSGRIHPRQLRSYLNATDPWARPHVCVDYVAGQCFKSLFMVSTP